MSTIFTKIINKEIPSYKIAENDKFYAFLDIFPICKGHTLVIPKQEIDYLFDLDDEMYSDLFLFAKQVAISIKSNLGCKRVAIVVMGMEVSHAHIHLIPIDNEGDIDFKKEKLKLTSGEFESIQKLISLL